MNGKVDIDKLICSLLVRHESDGLRECLTEALEDQGLRYDQERNKIVYDTFNLDDVANEAERLKNNPTPLERYYEQAAKDSAVNEYASTEDIREWCKKFLDATEPYQTMDDVVRQGGVDMGRPLKLEVREKCKYKDVIPASLCDECEGRTSCLEAVNRLLNADKVSETK